MGVVRIADVRPFGCASGQAENGRQTPANCRFLATLGMTRQKKAPGSLRALLGTRYSLL